MGPTLSTQRKSSNLDRLHLFLPKELDRQYLDSESNPESLLSVVLNCWSNYQSIWHLVLASSSQHLRDHQQLSYSSPGNRKESKV